MKLSKKIFAVILAVLFASICFFQTTSNAADVRYFGIKAIRTRTEPNFGYAITNPNSGGTKLWNIVEYDSETSTTFKNTGAYCMKAGVGFTGVNASGTNGNGSETYNKSFNMLTQRTDIAAQNAVLKGLVEGGQYNRLLAILDLIYVPGVSTETDKANLLKNAGIYPEAWDFALTDDDIEAIQQAAIWYFTNIEEPELFDKTAATHWLNYTTDGNVYKSLADYKKTAEQKTSEGWQRVDQAELLYNYLINTAKANESQYVNPKEVKAPVTVDTTTLSYEQVGKNYIVGPIHMTKNNDIPYTIEATLKNGTTDITDYKLLDSDKKETTKTISELVGNDFYYSIPVNGITEINISYKVKYTISGMTLWASTNNNQAQPIAVVEKQNKEPETNLSVTPKEKVFDLALRKYITAINDTAITDTRAPSIDEATLLTGTTATYKHRKDPVVIKNNDYVTYNLTVYNEGEFSGRATKIIDQLPEGLEFDSVVSGDYEKEFYDTTLNKLTLNKKGESNLDPYSEGNLDSETVTIKCKVTAVADTTSDKILTNVAWISEEYNAETEETIRTEVGKDRDSEPGTTPIVKKDNMSGYKGNTSNKEVTPADSNYFYKGEQDDDDFEKLKLEAIAPEGKYSVVLVKEDENGVQLDSEATFEVNGESKTVTGRLVIADQKQIESIETPDTYVIKETKAPDKYCEFDGIIKITANKEEKEGKYIIKSIDYTVEDKDGNDITEETGDTVTVELKNGNIYVYVKDYEFDLKLVKRITEINGQKVDERIKSIDVSKLNTAQNAETTANYDLNKDPLYVSTGDLVKYTFRIYNEGYVDGYASEITEDLPEGVKLVYSTKTGQELEDDPTFTEEEKEAIKYNQSMLWTYGSAEEKIIKTTYLSKDAEGTPGENLIEAFGVNDGTKTASDLKYKEVSVIVKVTAANETENIIRNEACISEDSDSKGNSVEDRDSDPHNWVKYEDDEDYDNIVLKSFDLSLRKFITAVSSDDEITEKSKITSRIPDVDTSKLNTIGNDGKLITTATYNHTKEPLQVTIGDLVEYTIRVYNEGETDGYAAEIKDHLPKYLEFVSDNEINKEYGWKVSDDGRTVTTTYLDDTKLEKATKNEGTYVLKYADVKIVCKVTDEAQSNDKITNIADITKYEDENKKEVKDRDSEENNVELPKDEKLPTYKDDEKGSYIPGQEDDDDFEKVIVKIFDLGLRKWVSQAIVIENGTGTVTETGHTPYDNPEDIVKVEINRKDWKNVTVKFRFGIRVFNQGDIAGYPETITDFVPEGLVFDQAENPNWTEVSPNVIMTDALNNTYLQPGEYADIDVLLTWVNEDSYVGLVMDNVATMAGKSDDAATLVSITTGQNRIYYILGTVVLVTLAGGVFLIKKYVLK